MLQLYPGNLSVMQPSHYGAFKDLRKEINHLDSAILLYSFISDQISGKEAAGVSGPTVVDGTNPTQVLLPAQTGLVDNVTGEPSVPIVPTEVRVDEVGDQQELVNEDGAESSHVGEWAGLNTGAEELVEPSMKDVLAAVQAIGTHVLALTRTFTPLVNSLVGQVAPAQTTARATQRTVGTAARVAQTAAQVAQIAARTVEDHATVDADATGRERETRPMEVEPQEISQSVLRMEGTTVGSAGRKKELVPAVAIWNSSWTPRYLLIGLNDLLVANVWFEAD
ncbi:hypothetical protein F2Q68_00043592 [Brassica cretica]|uniref:Uncharacterized protein n=1 Tax=Brassica cretica TaxID=69181 RepID=A0A8S9LJX1_BRACR|nr:hypothetical protein F2Q68_00043592 [Brassica cretica]